MKYSAKFTLNIPMKEFYEFAIPLVSKKELHKAIKSELYMCWSGITNGEWGGNACDWKQLVNFKNFFISKFFIFL
jgi:hypothetical protein